MLVGQQEDMLICHLDRMMTICSSYFHIGHLKPVLLVTCTIISLCQANSGWCLGLLHKLGVNRNEHLLMHIQKL